MDKNQIYQKKILKILLDAPLISVKRISKKIGISEKTVRIQINYLEDYLENEKIGHIDKIPSKGIKLVLNSGIDKNDLKESKVVEVSTEKAFFHILRRLLSLKNKEYVTQSELSDEIYVSLPTFRKQLEDIKAWLIERDLELEIVQKKGMRIKGEELSIWRAIGNLILKSGLYSIRENLAFFVRGLDIELVSKVIRSSEKSWQIQFSRDSFSRIWVMLSLSLYRQTPSNLKRFNNLDWVEKYSEYNFVETLEKNLKQYNLGRSLSEIDKKIMAHEILISSKLVWTTENENRMQNNRPTNLENFVNDLIEVVSDILQVDLRGDLILKKDLTEHLRSAIFRMKYSKANTSSLSKQLKEEYGKVYLSVWSTSQLFEEYYDIQVTENEICYIVMYIEAALMRIKNIVDLLYITDQTRSHSSFIVETIKHHIPEVESIKIVRNSETSNRVYDQEIAISDCLPEDRGTISISKIPTDQEISRIKNTIHHFNGIEHQKIQFSNSIQTLFDPQLFFSNMKVSNKEELLKMMCHYLEKMGYVTSDFFETVWGREKETSTCVGFQTAIPHGSMNEVNEPKIAVATLEQPILWFGEEEIQFVFLLAAKMNTKVNINKTKQFYTDLITLTEDKNSMNRFKKCEDGIKAYGFLFH
ncbi:PTS sugar transporter subunit IIA [Enterococcus sp. BWB1-3]|uniref:BglG family transcription antiterminator n=1 Tax=unclassified Enterococcus TaxID=2608891 RepID=UPI0019236FCA|nr:MULTISPECIES: PTS sugar transporter subunit IIA [unclassified Enterococcus]MBL1230027.1 PTS sugar transporter subunit IIA [Enterococcus sp. BWB1-3]MCB5952411.1 PTS sugar transporter subunit IIA [Enterococcus sp. BWT-B8]MCB5955365.1 PTS sugar transporter subunit IIA [Enterococcus sp. CWB-B31]